MGTEEEGGRQGHKVRGEQRGLGGKRETEEGGGGGMKLKSQKKDKLSLQEEDEASDWRMTKNKNVMSLLSTNTKSGLHLSLSQMVWTCCWVTGGGSKTSTNKICLTLPGYCSSSKQTEVLNVVAVTPRP